MKKYKTAKFEELNNDDFIVLRDKFTKTHYVVNKIRCTLIHNHIYVEMTKFFIDGSYKKVKVMKEDFKDRYYKIY